MSQPTVTITELDGALGILPTSAGRLLAVVGVSSAGPFDTPATYAKVPQLVADFGNGPMVEAAAYYIQRFGRPVLVVRTHQSTAGSYPEDDAVVRTGTGTSVITVDNTGTEPDDDFECYFEVVTGGTIGAAGITFKWSLDGGRTLSPVTALGTATSFVFPTSGGVAIEFAAGTLVAGDTASFITRAPDWTTGDLATALTALFATTVQWESAHFVGPLAGADFDAIDAAFSGALEAGKYRSWIGSCRMPDPGESESTYRTAMSAIFDSRSTIFGEVCAAACKIISAVSGRQYRRPVGFPVAALEGAVSEEVDIADVNLGALRGVSIRDDNGNPDEHDESLNPGLDDARFTVLRTWDGVQGVYVNRPRLLSPAGSDFDLFTKRRVLNLAHAALRLYFIRRLSKPIQVDAQTGFILESEALEIENGALAQMRSALLAKPKASGVQFTLSRTDNILSTKTLTGQARVIPLAYPETIEIELGFLNPALQVQTV